MREWTAKNYKRWREINNKAHSKYAKTAKGKAGYRKRYAKYRLTVLGKTTEQFNRCRRRARRDGRAFSLTKAWLLPRIAKLVCEATGVPLRIATGSPYTPSVDRKDNSKGYTPANCWVVSWEFNNLKKTKSVQEALAEYQMGLLKTTYLSKAKFSNTRLDEWAKENKAHVIRYEVLKRRIRVYFKASTQPKDENV
jgi:hypothetical protein